MKDNKWLISSLIALAVLVLIGVAFYVGKKSNSAPQNISENNSQPQETENNTADTPTKSTQTNISPKTSTKSSSTKSSSVNSPIVNQIIPQVIAQNLVSQTWGDCLSMKCKGYEVTVDRNNIVTAIYNLQNETIYSLRKQAVATYKNGVWKLGEPVISQECWLSHYHADGSQGFSSSPCI